jgi:uncharacterized membrane protein
MSEKSRTVLLVVSLALNLFLVGAIVGGLVIGQRMRGPPPAARGGPALWAAARTLPAEDRMAYREVLRGEGGSARRELRAAREARVEAWRTLADEPFNAATARRRLAEARALDAEARAALEDRIVDFAATLDAEERKRFVEGLTRPPPARPQRRGQPQND